MSEWRLVLLRPDQNLAIAAICDQFEERTGQYLSWNDIAREALDSSLPVVRQRYDELARAAQGKESE